jgi:hypothetical protein
MIRPSVVFSQWKIDEKTMKVTNPVRAPKRPVIYPNHFFPKRPIVSPNKINRVPLSQTFSFMKLTKPSAE